MSRWTKRVAPILSGVDDRIDALRRRLRNRSGSEGHYQIASYHGYGTSTEVYIRGRVLENKPLTPGEEQDTIWVNLLNMYRRFETDEVAGARVRIQFCDSVAETITNDEGYFSAALPVRSLPPQDTLWREGTIELVDPANSNGSAKTGVSVLIPPPSSRFGIISDLDDTVVQTNATQLLRMARTVFLGNAKTRVPFPGVAAFYEALQKGRPEGLRNPIFYVSSSPWNLYDLLVDFFAVQRIPAGPVFLRDWGISATEILPTNHHAHKLSSIQTILETYRDLPFLLIGDSGQDDPEIYRDLVEQYPKRILAVYIRNVSRDNARAQAVALLAEKVAKAGSTLVLAPDTLACARHAILQGWIESSQFPELVADKIKDEAAAKP